MQPNVMINGFNDFPNYLYHQSLGFGLFFHSYFEKYGNHNNIQISNWTKVIDIFMVILNFTNDYSNLDINKQNCDIKIQMKCKLAIRKS